MHYAPGFVLLMCSFLQSFNTLPWRAAHSEAFAFLAALVWAWSAVRRNAVQVRTNMPVIALLCLGLLIAIQYATRQIAFGGDAAILLLYVCLCVITLLIAQWHGNDAAWPTALAFTLLVIALVSAVLALTQALGVWTDIGWISRYRGFRRPSANLGQPNLMGTLLVMGAASLIYLDQRLGFSRLMTVLLSLILLVGMGMTESRTGLLSGITLCLWWSARRRVFIHAFHWTWVAASVLALIAIMWGWPPLISYIQEAGPPQTGVAMNTALGNRWDVWAQLWEAVWIKPWFGWGLRGVSTALNAVQHNYAHSAPFTYAHNIVLDTIIGMGLPLAGLALGAAGVWVWRRVKNAQTIEAWYAVGLLVPFAIHSLLEYPFAYAYFLVPAMLAIGMLEQNAELPVRKIIPRKIIFGILSFFSFLLIWVAAEYIELEEDFRVARFESLNLGQIPAGYEQPNIVLLTQLKAMVATARITPNPNMSHEEIDLLRTATWRFPWIPVQNAYALSLALNGFPQEAVRQLKVLRATHGEDVYKGIKAKWAELADTTYPQLKVLALP